MATTITGDSVTTSTVTTTDVDASTVTATEVDTDAAVKKYRYVRYETLDTISGHHPRVSRLWFIGPNGTTLETTTFVADNCADSGTIPNGYYTKDLGTPQQCIGFGFYPSYSGYRSRKVQILGSNDYVTWTTIGTGIAAADSCGEKEWYFG